MGNFSWKYFFFGSCLAMSVFNCFEPHYVRSVATLVLLIGAVICSVVEDIKSGRMS